MTALAEPVILTAHTLERLKGRVPPALLRDLEVLIHQIESLVQELLTPNSSNPAQQRFALGASRFGVIRLHLLQVFLGQLSPHDFADLSVGVTNFATERLEQEGWRLGRELQAVKEAWPIYSRMILNLLEAEPLPASAAVPPGLLRLCAEVDLCLTGTLMVVEGDMRPPLDGEMLDLLCKRAASATIRLNDMVIDLLAKRTGTRSERLDQLYGAWPTDPRIDAAVDEIYQTRT